MGSGEAVLRMPPQSLDAEQSVLGGILIEDRAITKVLDILMPQDFYREGHRKVFSAMIDLFDKSEPVDFITLTEALKKKGTLEDAGGIAYITSLVDNVPTAANIQYYAKIVKEKAILRGLIAASSEIIADSYEAKRDVDELLEKAESKIFEISEHKIKQAFFPIQKIVTESVEIIQHLYNKDLDITGVPTGFKDIDDMTAGLQPCRPHHHRRAALDGQDRPGPEHRAQRRLQAQGAGGRLFAGNEQGAAGHADALPPRPGSSSTASARATSGPTNGRS